MVGQSAPNRRAVVELDVAVGEEYGLDVHGHRAAARYRRPADGHVIARRWSRRCRRRGWSSPGRPTRARSAPRPPARSRCCISRRGAREIEKSVASNPNRVVVVPVDTGRSKAGSSTRSGRRRASSGPCRRPASPNPDSSRCNCPLAGDQRIAPRRRWPSTRRIATRCWLAVGKRTRRGDLKLRKRRRLVGGDGRMPRAVVGVVVGGGDRAPATDSSTPSPCVTAAADVTMRPWKDARPCPGKASVLCCRRHWKPPSPWQVADVAVADRNDRRRAPIW